MKGTVINAGVHSATTVATMTSRRLGRLILSVRWSLRAAESPDGPDTVSFRVGTSLEDAEKALIIKTLAANGNNKTRAADVLGISLKTLHNKLKAYGT